MKIAMFTDAFFPRINGVYISVKSFAVELAKLGHEVCIVCPSYEGTKKSYEEKLDVENGKSVLVLRISSHRFIFSKEDRFTKITQWSFLKKFLDEWKPDLVHINSEFVVGRFGYYYSKSRNIPMVFTFHTYWETYIKNYAKMIPGFIARRFGRNVSIFFIKRADCIIAPTQRFADIVKKYGIQRESYVLPTGISLNPVSKEDDKTIEIISKIKKDFPACEGKKILLYVGRIAIEKNLDFLLEVFDEIKKTNDDVCLIFVGGGPALEHLKEVASKSPNANLIHFTGYFEREELPYVYKMADIFVFPSMTETQGLVTIEAMMQNIPVVAIGEMGTLDVMQGDNGGFMVKNDLRQFVNRVQLLLNDKEVWAQKSKEAGEWSKQWSISVTAGKLAQIYENTLKS